MELARAKEVLKQAANHIMFKQSDFSSNIQEFGDEYKLVTESQRPSNIYIHIVPTELFHLFREWQEQHLYTFEGKSILLGRRDNKELRLAFFGIDLDEINQ